MRRCGRSTSGSVVTSPPHSTASEYLKKLPCGALFSVNPTLTFGRLDELLGPFYGRDRLAGYSRCRAATVEASRLEGLVWETVVGILRHPDLLAEKLEAHKAMLGARDIRGARPQAAVAELGSRHAHPVDIARRQPGCRRLDRSRSAETGTTPLDRRISRPDTP